MNNIWKIFKTDLKHLAANAISWVVVVGLIVIPSLYAWFCIYAFWDPYEHTENLKVAVASEDEGYESSLIPVNINIGKEVLEELRENPQMQWVFLDREEAVEGVRAGKYYAALVIPEDFSRDLLSILSEDVEKAEIDFYINEKENAIAATVTNQGADAIQKTIDEAFARTASEIVLHSLDTISETLSSEDSEKLADNLKMRLRDVSGELSSAALTIDNLNAVNASLNGLLQSTDELLTGLGETVSASSRDLDSMKTAFDSVEGDLNAISGKTDAVFQNTEQVYGAIDSAAAEYLKSMDADAEKASSSLQTFAGQVQNLIDRYQEYQDSIDALADSLPAELGKTKIGLYGVSVSLERSIYQQTQIRDSLSGASSDLASVSSDAVRYQKELSDYIAGCNEDIQNLRSQYNQDVKPQIRALTDSLEAAEKSVKTVTGGLRGAAEDMKGLAGDTSGQMEEMEDTLQATGKLLRDASERLSQILAHLEEEGDGSAVEILRNILDNDADTISGYFSSIVKLDSHVLYPVDNFGTAMTPFYTGLAIWVGAVILTAMLKVSVSDKLKKTLDRPKNRQLYLGRFGVFLLISLLQSLLIAVGDIFFLGVKCAHPLLFVATCLYTGVVFVTLIYTLAASFGNIGKAVAIILLVFQVAGSGGTIPIEMTPPFFHIFYPLLPLTHAMGALRECITGMYGSDYLRQMGLMAVYIGLSLLLGLVLRNPMIKLNSRFEEKVENTKVM